MTMMMMMITMIMIYNHDDGEAGSGNYLRLLSKGKGRFQTCDKGSFNILAGIAPYRAQDPVYLAIFKPCSNIDIPPLERV